MRYRGHYCTPSIEVTLRCASQTLMGWLRFLAHGRSERSPRNGPFISHSATASTSPITINTVSGYGVLKIRRLLLILPRNLARAPGHRKASGLARGEIERWLITLWGSNQLNRSPHYLGVDYPQSIMAESTQLRMSPTVFIGLIASSLTPTENIFPSSLAITRTSS